MTSNPTTSAVSGTGSRAANIPNLKNLKSPHKGGTKKEYEEFMDKIQNHISICWNFGEDAAMVLDKIEKPDIPEPKDLSDDEAKIKWKTRVWEQKVDWYAVRIEALEDNMKALYSLIKDSSSKIMKAKIQSKEGFLKADKNRNVIWLLNQIDNIMLNFEESKPKLIAINDQMERIMRLKQGDTTNEDYIKNVIKELKVYEKHAGDFLWGTTQKDAYTAETKAKLDAYKDEKNANMPDDEKTEMQQQVKRSLKDAILSMALIKQADTKKQTNKLKD